MSRFEESHIQQAIVKWARFQACTLPELQLLYAVPNGANVSTPNRIRLVAEGLRKGIPDLHLPIARGEFNSLYIEVKTEKGKLSKDQEEMFNQLELFGNKVVIVRSLFQGIHVLTTYLSLDAANDMHQNN